MEAAEREALAVKLELLIDGMNELLPDDQYRKGVIRGLKMATCHVRDNHPKEDDE